MKENKIEKLVLDLSNRWDCSPEEAVDRLNSMNESEINKLINSMTKKFAKGGMIDCLRNGGKPKDCGCGAKVRMGQDGLVAGEKKRRVDAAGDAWREKDGTAVLSRDAQGVRIQPGTDYVYENSTPPMRTEMRIKTDKGGRPKRWYFDVWNDNGDNNFSPVYRYSSERTLDPRRKVLTTEALNEYLEAYRKNGLLRSGGIINKKK